MELACDLFIIPFRVLLCPFSFFVLPPHYSENLGTRINEDCPTVLQKIPKPTAPARVKMESEDPSAVFSPAEAFSACLLGSSAAPCSEGLAAAGRGSVSSAGTALSHTDFHGTLVSGAPLSEPPALSGSLWCLHNTLPAVLHRPPFCGAGRAYLAVSPRRRGTSR